jgi:hypothetical protein
MLQLSGLSPRQKLSSAQPDKQPLQRESVSTEHPGAEHRSPIRASTQLDDRLPVQLGLGHALAGKIVDRYPEHLATTWP